MLLLPCCQAYASQLSDMTRHIQSVQHASHEERSMASVVMSACGNSMAMQRGAGVGLTSSAGPLSYAPQAPLRTPGYALAASRAAAAAASMPPAAANKLTLADSQQQQQQQEERAVPWAQSNAMRQEMSSRASNYVSKRNRQ
jgi:hypothetical protein